MPSWALTKLKETHSLDGFYAALKCGDMKKDFSALHLQETATEAGTEITQDLYSSAPEYHLNTIHERLKKTTARLQGNALLVPTGQAGAPTDRPESSPGYSRTRTSAGLLLQGPRQLRFCCTGAHRALAGHSTVPPGWGAGRLCSRSILPSGELQQAESSFTKKALPSPPPKKNFLQDSDITRTSHLPDFQHLG